MIRKKRVAIVATLIATIILIIIGIFLFCVWGNIKIDYHKVRYESLQKLVGADCPVPIGLDVDTSSARLIFPSGMDDARAFYPMEIWGDLHKKTQMTLAISPNHPCIKFDTITLGENKKANGYQLFFKGESETNYLLAARKHTTEKNAKIGDYVNEYLFYNIGEDVEDVSISYDVINKNTFIAFALKKSIYYIKFTCNESMNKQLIKEEVTKIIKSML